jgi:hypothetical protein
MGNNRIGHAIFANAGRESARVEAIKADDAAFLQPYVKIALRSVAGWMRNRRVDNDTPCAGIRCAIVRLDILVVDAGIADMREGECDDLAGIRGIGEDLLIAGHRRVEADFANGRTRGPKPKALQHHAIIRQNEQRRCAGFAPGGKSLLLRAHRLRSNSICIFR